MSEEYTGVENVPAAGEQVEESQEETVKYDHEEILFGEEETGVEKEEPAAAEQEGQEETTAEDDTEGQGEYQFNESTEVAFAKRLAAEREKIKQEVEAEYKQQQQQQQQQQQPQQQRPLTKDEIEKIADDLALTPEAVQVLYNQQLTLNQQNELLRRTQESLHQMQEEATKNQVKAQVEQQRLRNSHLPPFDEQKITEIRQRYHKQYGISMPWDAAYRQLVADEALSGNLFKQSERDVEQRTINQISRRNKTNVQAGKGSKQAKKPSVWDIPDSEFEKMLERAKAGEFKKS